MSKCIKTGLDVATPEGVFHTDAHLAGDSLFFTLCDEQHKWPNQDPGRADLAFSGDYIHTEDHALIVLASECTVQSRRLYDQWAEWDADVLDFVQVNLIKE